MATELILRCSHCRDQFLTEPVKVTLDGEDVHLCSASCQLKWYARLYHKAMESHATIHVSMKGENG